MAARHERPEAAGGDEVVDEVAGQRARLLDLVGTGGDRPAPGRAPRRASSAVRSWSSLVHLRSLHWSTSTNASGCSSAGSSAAFSTTCSGQPNARLAASATRSGVARSWRPQISVVGTEMRARIASPGSRRPRTRPSAPPTARQPRRLPEAVDGVVAVGRPALTEPPPHAVEVVDAVLHQPVLGLRRSGRRGSAGALRRTVAPARTPTGRACRRGRAARPDRRARRRGASRWPRREHGRRRPEATAHVLAMTSSSQAITRSAPSSPSAADSPWPGRSGATTWCRAASASSTSDQPAANSPGPWSRTMSGPAPASSTAVEMPAASIRRSVIDVPASSRASGAARWERWATASVDIASPSVICSTVRRPPARAHRAMCATPDAARRG